MPRPAPRHARSDCPFSIALEILGDSWSLLIVRDLMFKERKTFKDFLEAEEGIASNVLSARLRRLEAAGLITKRPNPADARRHTYHLTETGIDLAPVLLELVLWSARHFNTGAPEPVLREMKQRRERFLRGLRKHWKSVAPD